MRVGSSKMAIRLFRSLYLPNIHIQSHNYYTVKIIICTVLFVDTEMTLNDHFVLKSVLGFTCHGLPSSGFRTKVFKQSCMFTVRSKNVAQ